MDEDLIELIHESAFVPEHWPQVIDRLSELAGAQIGSVTIFGDSAATLWKSSPTDHHGPRRFVEENWLFRGRFGALVQASNYPGFTIESDVWTPQQIADEPMYQELFGPEGYMHNASTIIRLPSGQSAFLAVNRRTENGPVERQQVQRLDALRPHLARSALVSARLQMERAGAMSEAMALLNLPAVVLNEAGKILAANHQIETLTDCVRFRAQDRMSLKDSAADTVLRGIIEAFPRSDASPAQSFPLRDAEGRALRVAHVVPIRRSARDIFVRCAAVIILAPIGAPHAPPVELVRSLFDLTPAEANVARSLVGGDTVEMIATSGGVSLRTVRSQVRGVLEKTGCTRQADVVALLAGIATPRAT